MTWTRAAWEALDAARLEDGSWGYRPDGTGAAEPTALVVLASRAHGRTCGDGVRWLAGLQEPGGGVPVRPGFSEPHWPTALALLAWIAEGGHGDAVERAVEFLLAFEGTHPAQDPTVGHDTSIVGWPWIAAAHSWVEPTSYAICALKRAGYTSHPRLESGRALLLDRVVATGGWNYGNTSVLGGQLWSYPAPTGAALLATLPELVGQEPIVRSVACLERQVADVRSPLSLGWALLGLAAAGRLPEPASAWLQASYERLASRGLAVPDLALLLLASRAGEAASLFGGLG